MKNQTLQQIAGQLATADSVVLLTHTKPDGDCIGSAVGLGVALRAMGKNVRVFCPDELPSRLRFLLLPPGIDEPVEYICTDADFPCDWLSVSVDVASRERTGAADHLDEVDIMLDHHAEGSPFGTFQYIDPTAAATGEIIFDLISFYMEQGAITRDTYLTACAALYAAIASDTGCFRYANTTERTLRIAADMKAAGVDFGWANKPLFESRDAADVIASSVALSTIELLCGGRVAFMVVDAALMRRHNVRENDFGAAIGVARDIAGVQMAVKIRQSEGDSTLWSVSVRSDESVDSAAFCAAIGGGGHLRAAGATLRAATPQEAREKMLAMIEREFSCP